MLLLTVLEGDQVMYCMTDPGESAYLGQLTGHVVGDFNADAMLDIAGFDSARQEILIFYNQLEV